MPDYSKQTGKHGLEDKLISRFNEIFFTLYEPLALRFMRLRHENLYKDKNDDPLVTIYIPTYNRVELLMERAVPSVIAQTYKNIEIVIIGDHCTDKTETYVSGIKDNRVRFYNIPKRGYRYPPTAENHWLAGPVVAANKALELARGKWIARIDDDDTWTPDHIEVLLRFAQRCDYEFVSSACFEERNGSSRIDHGIHARAPFYTRKKTMPRDPGPLIGGTSTWLYRTYLKFIKYNINCWRKEWNRVNDIDISLRIFQAGVRMGFIDKPLLYIRPRPGEQTIGLEAYMLTASEKEVEYRFET